MRPLLILALWSLAMACHAQPLFEETVGPAVRHHWSRSYNRLLHGGDGKFYLFQNRSGNYWNFGQTGEARSRMLVFGPDLALLGNHRVCNSAHKALHVYEAFETPDGIRVLAMAPVQGGKGAWLMLGTPDPDTHGEFLHCDTLQFFPSFNHRIQAPRFRMAFSPDSSLLAIAWRLGTNLEEADNGMEVLLLDRNYRPQGKTFYPLLSAAGETYVLGMAMDDRGSLLFHLRVISERNLAGRPQVGGQLLAFFDQHTRLLSPVQLGHGRIPLDIKLHLDKRGNYWALGTYLHPLKDNPEVGLYTGLVGSGDTLQQVRLHPFPDSLESEFLLPKALGGNPDLRPSFHNQFFGAGDDLYYVQNLRGPALHLHPSTPTPRHLNLLVAWRMDSLLNPLGMRLWGFCQEGRTDYTETYSWRALDIQGLGHAMVTDYGSVRKISRPTDARTYLLPLAGDAEASVCHVPGAHLPYSLIAPRTAARLAKGHWVFLSRSQHNLRLVRYHFLSP
jgi:hypothetical protein